MIGMGISLLIALLALTLVASPASSEEEVLDDNYEDEDGEEEDYCDFED